MYPVKAIGGKFPGKVYPMKNCIGNKGNQEDDQDNYEEESPFPPPYYDA